MRRLIAVLLLALAAVPAQAQSTAAVKWHASHPLWMLRGDIVSAAGVVRPGSGSGGGASLTGTNVFSGSNQFTDTLFKVCDDGDLTKCVLLQVSGVTTGTSRTLTIPNLSATILTTGSAGTSQTLIGSFTMPQLNAGDGIYFGGFNNNSNAIIGTNADTPDTARLSTGSTSNAWLVAPTIRATTDYAHPVQTNPWIFWQLAGVGAPTTEYSGVGAVGSVAGLFKTLTESAATSAVRIPVAASAGAGGIFEYGIFAADATDQQLRESSIRYSVTNKAGTETCVLTGLAGAADASITETEDGNAASISAGTLTYAITCDTTPANAVDIQINAVSSLTQTTLQVRYQVRHLGPGEPLPQ